MQDDKRLSEITTLWNEVRQAHRESAADVNSASAIDARQRLLMRYRGAIRRYLLGAVGNVEDADDLFGEFSVKFLRRDLHRVDPERGRFRDYVRTVLINLVNDHFRRQHGQPRSLDSGLPEPKAADDSDTRLDACLRDDLMERTWKSLQLSNPNYYLVLRQRVADVNLTARQIGESLDPTMTASNVRKTLERAREKFAELLLDEVISTLEFDDPAQLRNELKRFKLLEYCRSAFDRRFSD